MRTHTFKGGIHPREMKELSNQCPITDAFPASKTVTIPVTMGGAPNTPVVKVGDLVAKGQVIATGDKFMNCPVHASIAGKVKKIGSHIVTGNGMVPCIVIESDGSDRTEFMEPLEEKLLINILKQLLIGLKYLHKKGIMHRDITPDNILLDENNNVKITDFGISAFHKDNKTTKGDVCEEFFSQKTMVGRISYASPQVQKGEEYDYSCDIYSLGVTILYLMSYENPIVITKNPLGKKIREQLKFENIHKKYNSYLQNLIKRMVKDEPELRPTSSEAYDELELIEISKEYSKNKLIKKLLDGLNKQNKSESESKPKSNGIKKEEPNKNIQIMNTGMNPINRNDKSENKTPYKSENKTLYKSENKTSYKSENKTPDKPENKTPDKPENKAKNNPSKEGENEFSSYGGIYSNNNNQIQNPYQSIHSSTIANPGNPPYANNYSLHSSINVNDYPETNNNFYYTQIGFRRNKALQNVSVYPPPPPVMNPPPTPVINPPTLIAPIPQPIEPQISEPVIPPMVPPAMNPLYRSTIIPPVNPVTSRGSLDYGIGIASLIQRFSGGRI